MNTYIYLSQEDMLRLKKLAESKRLSLSACVDIIAEGYHWFVEPIENYINKGKIKTMLVIKNKATWPVKDKIATNCVYAYFHNEALNFYPNKAGIKNTKRKIQSEMDKRYDPNYMKNIMIRTLYRINKGQTA